MNRRPICFIAMAFEKEDTDILYEKHILPVLKQLNITPIIINRQEKNDDINIQIIEALEKCDFAIVDLTYARQSVYFEAGYAQRKVDVIYTVRSDHFNNGNPDNQRVHFDLAMKPIISWKDINDTNFVKRLSRRIKATALKEWEENNDKEIELENSRLIYKILTQNEKLIFLRGKTIKRLQKEYFLEWNRYPSYENLRGTYTNPQIKKGIANDIYAKKVESNNISLITINSFPSVTKSRLDNFFIQHDTSTNIRLVRDEIDKSTRRIRINHFIFSLRSIPNSRIEDVLPHYREFPNSHVFMIHNNPSMDFSLRNINKKVNIDNFLYFFSDIDCELKLNSELDNRIKKYLYVSFK